MRIDFFKELKTNNKGVKGVKGVLRPEGQSVARNKGVKDDSLTTERQGFSKGKSFVLNSIIACHTLTFRSKNSFQLL